MKCLCKLQLLLIIQGICRYFVEVYLAVLSRIEGLLYYVNDQAIYRIVRYLQGITFIKLL